MKILLCCEHFHPSVGGVQKMMHEIGHRFTMKGHEVSVATSWNAGRTEDCVDGIKIHSFRVHGNSVLGMSGEVEKYQDFLINGGFDFLLVMAAQQWTFDAMLPVLENIPSKKIHIPCGYSGFYLPKYEAYFRDMDVHLRKFDQLIYNSTDYRDINFARERKIPNINVIPAGASELEFMDTDKGNVLEKIGIDGKDFIYLSVGAPSFNKGHKEILEAYLLLDAPFNSTLVLNGDYSRPVSLAPKHWLANPRQSLKELAKRFLGKSSYNIMKLARQNRNPAKNIIFTNLPRADLIRLFFNADLFLFASHVEYSPLVIFECLAAGLPFLSIPVGNVDEIIEWSHGGVLASGKKDRAGFSLADPQVFAREMRDISLDSERRRNLSENGRQAWLLKFTWAVIASQIEQLAIRDRV
jgi:glycosyltransferase involved in cell wall biosynthesis